MTRTRALRRPGNKNLLPDTSPLTDTRVAEAGEHLFSSPSSPASPEMPATPSTSRLRGRKRLGKLQRASQELRSQAFALCPSPGQEQGRAPASETSQAQHSARELARAGSSIESVMLDLARTRLLRPKTVRARENSNTVFQLWEPKQQKTTRLDIRKRPSPWGPPSKEGRTALSNETTFPWDTDKDDFTQELPPSQCKDIHLYSGSNLCRSL